MEQVIKGETTLAILLGAKAFPKSPGLSARPSFENSVQAFRTYLLDQFRLPPDNIKDFFDVPSWPAEILESTEEFIQARKAAVNAQDLILYYVGHGGQAFQGGGTRFFLATRSTREEAETSTGIIAADLASSLYRAGKMMRYYIVLDCCFSAAAYSDFQAPPLQVVTTQMAEPLPAKGTLLFCAAGNRDVALAPKDEEYTRFSSALLKALLDGDPQAEEYLSFADLGRQVETILQARHPDKWARPQVTAPDARQGDLANLTAFPNRAYRRAQASAAYFTRFVRRNGVPVGLAPISQDQAAQRARSIRLTYEKNRVRRLETVNGAGVPTPDVYGADYLKTSWRGSEQNDAACRWDFSYDEAGRVAMEEIANANGRVVARCAYSMAAASGRGTTAHYFLTASEIAHPQTRSGAAFVRISRDDAGFDRRLEYFDGMDRRQPDELGSFGRDIDVDERGLEIRSTQLGPDLSPAICREGYAIARRDYDAAGNLIRERYFDVDETPLLHKDGYHSACFEWSQEGNWIGVRLFDVEGRPALGEAGFASWKGECDTAGNLIKQIYYDTAGNPTQTKEGVASWTAIYDGQGRMVRQRYYGVDGTLYPSKDGVAEWVLTRNQEERREAVQFLDAGGHPCVSRANISRIARRFDEQGKLIEELYYDANGEPVRNLDGFAGQRVDYDPAGNETEITFLGPDGAPDWDNIGVARTTMSYDSRRNMTERRLFGPDGSPAEDRHGRHRFTYLYDVHSNQCAVAYFNASGQPALLDGYASATGLFDENSGAMIRQEFRDAAGELTRQTAGYAIEEYARDRFGRTIRMQYRDIDNAPIVSAQGYAAWTADYDARGKCVRKCYFDTNDAPAVSVDGYAAWAASFDQRGNCLSMRYFGPDGKPATSNDGVAGWNATYDPRDNQAGIEYVDVEGGPSRRNEGFARWTASYDSTGNKIEERYFDVTGEPAFVIGGVSRRTWTYDTLRKCTSEWNWDATGQRVAASKGYAGWEAAYNNRGLSVEQSFLGADGNPTVNAEGCLRIETDYDDKGRIVECRWFGSASSSYTRVTYAADGSRVETSIGDQNKIVCGFDRAGRQTHEAYFSTDGARIAHLEKDLSYSFWETEYDIHGRPLEQRYFDVEERLTRRLRKVFTPTGAETESTLEEQTGDRREIVRTTRTQAGSEVETLLTDLDHTAVCDNFGRSRWSERFDSAGNRLEIAYFGQDGSPVAYQGHYGCKAVYDPTNRLIEARYEIPLEADDRLIKTFRFSPDQPREILFQSFGNGAPQRNNAFVIEYLMVKGDAADYMTVVKSVTDDSPVQEFRMGMRQTCTGVDANGRYAIDVESVLSDAGDIAQNLAPITMMMTRTGEIVQSSVPAGFSSIAFPTHPIFVGETWRKWTTLQLQNPFTGLMDRPPLQYTYHLEDVILIEGQPAARIAVMCPKTEFGIGRDASTTFTAQGSNLFDIRRGLLLSSEVVSETTMKVGADIVTSRFAITVALHPG